MDDWVSRVVAKLEHLKALDPNLWVAGATNHKYRLGPTLEPNALLELERRYRVTLPEDYRRFLLEVGNGGAGPGYGLERFGFLPHPDAAPKGIGTGVMRVVAEEPGRWSHSCEELQDAEGNVIDRFEVSYYEGMQELAEDPRQLARTFPLTDPVVVLEATKKWWNKVYPRCNHGTLYLAHYGCGIVARLVVTGEHRGAVWVNDLGSDNGIYPYWDYQEGEILSPPRPCSFAEWYEDELEREIVQIEREYTEASERAKTRANVKQIRKYPLPGLDSD